MAHALVALLTFPLIVTAATISPVPPPSSPPPLADRLRLASASFLTAGEGGGQQQGSWLMECWGAVAELRACTDEMVLFFLNGESYLGTACCVAIRTVTRHCWPSMLDAVGFTAREADVLRGFCDAEVSQPPPPPATPSSPPSPPAPAPAPAKHT